MTELERRIFGPENSLLGGLLLAPEYAAEWFARVSAIVSANDFEHAGHRDVFRAMGYLHKKQGPITSEAVTQELAKRDLLQEHGGPDFIDSLTPAASNLAYYAQQIRDRAVQRRVREAGELIAKLAPMWHGTAGEFTKHAQRLIQNAQGGPETA